MTTLDFAAYKKDGRKISMVTCYDATFAKIIDKTDIDTILIGDSASMVMHGESTTIPTKMEWMEEHTRSVRNGTSKFIVADMPFLTTRKGQDYATDCAGRLLVAGANSVKIEGVFGQEKILEHLTLSGIPVMAHLGLTPQFYQAFGGHKMQGKTEEAAEKIIEEAKLAARPRMHTEGPGEEDNGVGRNPDNRNRSRKGLRRAGARAAGHARNERLQAEVRQAVHGRTLSHHGRAQRIREGSVGGGIPVRREHQQIRQETSKEKTENRK